MQRGNFSSISYFQIMNPPVIGAYYFPNFHADPRNDSEHGRGWTEWELLKTATPRFPGHHQPLVPEWGYEDESDPTVMEKKIDAAADYGVDLFIFDWYHYDDGEFLNGALDRGYLGAHNNHRARFCLMWANHDWREIMPAKLGRTSEVLYPGKVTSETMERMAETISRKYLTHPSYFLIEGRAYFSFYDLCTLIEQAGGVSEAARQLEAFRERVRACCGVDLHINGVVFRSPVLPGERVPAKLNELIVALGLDSTTSYVWTHHCPRLNTEALVPYDDAYSDFQRFWHEEGLNFSVPYFPNVTMGWDATPRTVQSDCWEVRRYPFTGLLTGNTPERFGSAIAEVLAELRDRGLPEFLTINAWNEWTEGSYLEPDKTHGFAYLESIRDAKRNFHHRLRCGQAGGPGSMP